MASSPEQKTEVDRLELSVPPQAGSVAMARLFAASVARHFGCDEDIVEDLKVAMSEACTNAVKAHERAGVDVPIQIAATPEEDGLRFEIVDAGEGIDLGQAGLDAVSTPPTGLYEGSLGLVLIRSLFGDVEIARNEERGTAVRFVAPFAEDLDPTFADLPDVD